MKKNSTKRKTRTYYYIVATWHQRDPVKYEQWNIPIGYDLERAIKVGKGIAQGNNDGMGRPDVVVLDEITTRSSD